MRHWLFRGMALAWFSAAALDAARAQTIELISTASSGALGNNNCANSVALSGDGRFVGFTSRATNLLPGVTQPGHGYLFDRRSQTLELLTVVSGGLGLSAEAAIGGVSDDGRYVAFQADGLVDSDYGSDDIYVRDRVAGTTVELTPFEFQGLQRSVPQLSADGQRVAWWEENNWFFPFQITSILVKTPTGGAVAAVQAQSQGQPNDSWVFSPALSGDGASLAYRRRTLQGTAVMHWAFGTPGSTPVQIAFASQAAGVVVDPVAISANGRFVAYTLGFGGSTFEAWLYDVTTAALERIDPPVSGQLQWPSMISSISDDGRLVAFSSFAANLVAGDTNGWVDAFVRDRSVQQTFRINLDSAGAPSNRHIEGLALSRSGSLAAFVTGASNFVAGDVNNFSDVYIRSLMVFTDADGDGWGAGPGVVSHLPPQPGQASRGGDCSDANAAVHPGQPEICNGVDDDCSGVIDDDLGTRYCVPGTASNGCSATVGSTGCPSASQSSGYVLHASRVAGQRNLIWFYGVSPSSVPFGAASTMCVAAPRQRLPLMQSSGTVGKCDGNASIDVLSWAAAQSGALLVPWNAGQALYFQVQVRDPGAGAVLSGGWTFTLTP